MTETCKGLLLLDADGTIREPASGETFINDPYDQRIISGADEAIKHYFRQEFLIIAITNQGGCSAINRRTGKPYKSRSSCIEEQRYTLKLLPEILAIYFCPDDGKTCVRVQRDPVLDVTEFGERPFGADLGSYRKPGPEMLNLAMQIAGVQPRNSHYPIWYVGDRPEDEAAAGEAGVNFMWADIWRDRWIPAEYKVKPRAD